LNLDLPNGRQVYNVQILFFAKQDDFGNFRFMLKSKVKIKNSTGICTFLNFAFCFLNFTLSKTNCFIYEDQ